MIQEGCTVIPKEFIKLRLDMALQMLESIHTDLCKESVEGVSQQTADECGHILCDLRSFVTKFNKR